MSQLEEGKKKGKEEWERKRRSAVILDIGDSNMGEIEFLTVTSLH